MNLFDIVEELRKIDDFFAFRGEFEAEGMDTYDLLFLTHLAKHSLGKIVIKLGGQEAKTDFRRAILMGADRIIFPMVESTFAVKKILKLIDSNSNFIGVLGTKPSFSINIESKQAIDNLDDILNSIGGVIDTVTLGRIDLADSMGFTRENLNSIDKFVLYVAEKVKQHSINFAIGGGMDLRTLSLLDTLASRGLLGFFETRKLAFTCRYNKNFEEILKLAIRFELEYFKLKQQYLYSELDLVNSRLEILESKRF